MIQDDITETKEVVEEDDGWVTDDDDADADEWITDDDAVGDESTWVAGEDPTPRNTTDGGI